MKHTHIYNRLSISIIFILLASVMTNLKGQESESVVLIETNYGNIKVKLYNETPLHRDNFLKLVKDETYKDLLFHRVINEFMIQGGDPTSRTASDTTQLGSGDLGYTIPAEIKTPQLFHKKGALAAARTANEVNPERESSASQFYIVTGQVLSESDLKKMDKQRVERLKQSIFNELQNLNKPTIKELYATGDRESLNELRNNMIEEAEEEARERQSEVLFTEEQKDIYRTIGGTPFLDGEYTVFGEVIEGLDVVDKIQQVKTNGQDRPAENIKMNIVLLSE